MWKVSAGGGWSLADCLAAKLGRPSHSLGPLLSSSRQRRMGANPKACVVRELKPQHQGQTY